MAQKSFFEKSSPEEIQDSCSIKRVFRQRLLVEQIWNLNPEEAIEVRTPLIPLSFLQRAKTQAQSSRKHYKHGLLIHIDQPETKKEAYEFPNIPLTLRMKAFDEAFRDKKEEEIYYLGITWQPLQSLDRRWRVVPFDVPIEGAKIYSYAFHNAGGIDIEGKYTNAKKVQAEGGQILCKVPSRTEGKERYRINLLNVPLMHGKEKNSIIWSLKSQYLEGKEPERSTFLHNLRYEWAQHTKSSDIFVFGPHETAAYFAIIHKYWKGLENTVPLEMNPFPLPSKDWARFYELLKNNVIIYDPTLRSKKKLRNLHLDEVCIMLSRSIKVKGPYNTAYWDMTRDGPIKNYWK